ncbi:MAG: YbaB/EbfC family nucleoid-associated protein [Rhodospirillaceae bacterium]|nr:YbaB/EbfC family nucleoid-associated protein [Rhodospirillaceae bacterium]
MKDMMDLVRQANQMRGEMRRVQKQLASLEVQGEAGGGMVKIVMTCNHRVRRLEIEDSLAGERKSMLEDLIKAAFNDALKKVERTVKDQMSNVTGGMLPPGMKLPF